MQAKRIDKDVFSAIHVPHDRNVVITRLAKTYGVNLMHYKPNQSQKKSEKFGKGMVYKMVDKIVGFRFLRNSKRIRL